MKYVLCFCFFCFGVSGFSQTKDIPVTITVFDAGIASGKVTLNWKTACSLDFAHFEVQRSSDGIHFSTVSRLTADRSRCAFPFFQIDSNFTPGSGRYFYRLLVTDIDGTLYNSRTLTLFSTGSGFEINGLIPTLVNDGVLVSISSATNVECEWMLINPLGVMVQKRKISIKKGATSFQLNTSFLSRGVYSLIVSGPEFQKRIVRFLKI